MSVLAVKQLSNEEIANMSLYFYDNQVITDIRFHLYKKGTITDGNLVVNIKSEGELLAQATLSLEKIQDLPGTYFHGMVKFDLDKQIRINKKGYRAKIDFEIFIENHTDSNDNYIALVKPQTQYRDLERLPKTTIINKPDFEVNYTNSGMTFQYPSLILEGMIGEKIIQGIRLRNATSSTISTVGQIDISQIENIEQLSVVNGITSNIPRLNNRFINLELMIDENIIENRVISFWGEELPVIFNILPYNEIPLNEGFWFREYECELYGWKKL